MVGSQTPASLLRKATNDYSDAERQFEEAGGVFIDISKHAFLKSKPAGRVRRKIARDALLEAFLKHDEDVPFLTVVVNVAGRARAFADVLRSLAHQSFVQRRPSFVEVVLVQDGPKGVLDHEVRDNVLNALADFPAATKIKAFRLASNYTKSEGRATARNVGICYASRRAKVFLFIDDAMILQRDFVAEQMLRHAYITRPIALLGFKENRKFRNLEEYKSERVKLLSGRPRFQKDWKWSHKLKKDEATEYRGKNFATGSIIRYMDLTNNLKALSGNEPIGRRAFPMFFHTGLTSVTASAVREVGGFEQGFDVNLWGLEDSYLGLLLVAIKGVALIPCPSSVAYKAEFKDEKEVQYRDLEAEYQRGKFWERARTTPWNSYSETRLRKRIARLWLLKLLERVKLKARRKKTGVGGDRPTGVKSRTAADALKHLRTRPEARQRESGTARLPVMVLKHLRTRREARRDLADLVVPAYEKVHRAPVINGRSLADFPLLTKDLWCSPQLSDIDCVDVNFDSTTKDAEPQLWKDTDIYSILEERNKQMYDGDCYRLLSVNPIHDRSYRIRLDFGHTNYSRWLNNSEGIACELALWQLNRSASNPPSLQSTTLRRELPFRGSPENAFALSVRPGTLRVG